MAVDPSRLELRTLPLSIVQQLSCVEQGHRVTDAVKELIENSIDAGATGI
jgi:DNA mismatch repair ATPase MutL